VDNPGFPYDEWNGASCVVENSRAGQGGRYVQVRLVIPRADISAALFHPETVKPENRPWLKKNLREFLSMRKDLLEAAERIHEKYGDTR
jgi:hypothetical protein